MRSALSLAADSVMHPARHACRTVQPTFVSFVKWVSRVGDFFSSKCTRVCKSQKKESYLTGRCFLDRNRTLSWKKKHSVASFKWVSRARCQSRALNFAFCEWVLSWSKWGATLKNLFGCACAEKRGGENFAQRMSLNSAAALTEKVIRPRVETN